MVKKKSTFHTHNWFYLNWPTNLEKIQDKLRPQDKTYWEYGRPN